jgi:hypothetical protein
LLKLPHDAQRAVQLINRPTEHDARLPEPPLRQVSLRQLYHPGGKIDMGGDQATDAPGIGQFRLHPPAFSLCADVHALARNHLQ